ncbi:hypothetical protein [Streptomyces sp. SAS_270]|uniref:hypothetical protein n=1 Tax=Streptomyces sp. SAS_270 TaxID=3412748 RepID=UPI00403D476D
MELAVLVSLPGLVIVLAVPAFTNRSPFDGRHSPLSESFGAARFRRLPSVSGRAA